MEKIGKRLKTLRGNLLYMESGHNDSGTTKRIVTAIQNGTGNSIGMVVEHLKVVYQQEERVWDTLKGEYYEGKRKLDLYYPDMDMVRTLEETVRKLSPMGLYYTNKKQETTRIQEALGTHTPKTFSNELSIAHRLHRSAFKSDYKFLRYFCRGSVCGKYNVIPVPSTKFGNLPLLQYPAGSFVWYLPFMKSSKQNPKRDNGTGWSGNTQSYVAHRVYTNVRRGEHYIVPIKIIEEKNYGSDPGTYAITGIVIQEDLVQGPYSIFGTTNEPPMQRMLSLFLDCMYENMGVYPKENKWGNFEIPNHEAIKDPSGVYNEVAGTLFQQYYADALHNGINIEGDNPTLPRRFIHRFLNKNFKSLFTAVGINVMQQIYANSPDKVQIDKALWKSWTPGSKRVKVRKQYENQREQHKTIPYAGYDAKCIVGTLGIAMHFGLKQFNSKLYEEYALQMSAETLLPEFTEVMYKLDESTVKGTTTRTNEPVAINTVEADYENDIQPF